MFETIMPFKFFLQSDASNIDSSDSSWIDSSDDCSDNDGTKIYSHFGTDLLGFSGNDDDYHGLLPQFSQMTTLNTMSVGTRKAFVIGNDNLLKVITL